MQNKTILKDLTASIVVFLVALPLCLGIALASGAPLLSGIISGIAGALVVGTLSGSHTSVSGPAAGLSAVVLASIAKLGSFEVFLASVVIAGVIQLILGFFKLGFFANYFPSNVINGLLSAIGIILVLKQLPHAIGYDKDHEGDFSFKQADGENTFSALLEIFSKFEPGAVIISIISLLILIFWDKTFLKKLSIPAPLIVVLLSIAINEFFKSAMPSIAVTVEHLVNIPAISSISQALTMPDFSSFLNPLVYNVGLTIAIVATLETLLNLEAVDKIDPHKRHSPPNRELIAQGFGNIVSGLAGGIPVTSVIVRSSVNINAGGETKLSAIFHGVFLVLSLAVLSSFLNLIPLCSLAAILIVTGFKLANFKLLKSLYLKGKAQLIPYLVTVIGVVFTDILTGIILGLAVSIFFILRENFFNPFKYINEKFHKDEMIRIRLAPQVTFLHKATITETLANLPDGSSVTIDASNCEYIDNDVAELIADFKDVRAKEKNINLNIIGFKDQYILKDDIKFVPIINKEVQQSLSPDEILNLLLEGNKRFVEDRTLNRKHLHHLVSAEQGQHPMATILSCIDSRAPAEILFDVGLGDIFNIRIAGNIVDEEIIASLEFTCEVAGSKLILVMGHTDCGAIKGACGGSSIGFMHYLFSKLNPAVESVYKSLPQLKEENPKEFYNEVARTNVRMSLNKIREKSDIIRELENSGKIKLVPALYHVGSGVVKLV